MYVVVHEVFREFGVVCRVVAKVYLELGVVGLFLGWCEELRVCGRWLFFITISFFGGQRYFVGRYFPVFCGDGKTWRQKWWVAGGIIDSFYAIIIVDVLGYGGEIAGGAREGFLEGGILFLFSQGQLQSLLGGGFALFFVLDRFLFNIFCAGWFERDWLGCVCGCERMRVGDESERNVPLPHPLHHGEDDV